MVCHDSWDKVDADVACKEANFSRGALAVSTHLDSYGLNFYMDEVDCNGTEEHLHLCKKGERNDCGRDQAAGAVCDSATPVFQTAYMPIKGKLFCFWCNFLFCFQILSLCWTGEATR